MNEQELSKLKAERDRLSNRGFLMLVEQIPILAGPAILAAFGGTYLVKNYNAPQWIIAILLIAALWVSWSIILRRLQSFQDRIRTVSEKIRELSDTNTGTTTQ